MTTTRRHFLIGFAATIAVAATPKPRRYWPAWPGQKTVAIDIETQIVGKTLQEALAISADCDDIAAWNAAAILARGGTPVIRMTDGKTVTVRDFRESDKYDTIVISAKKVEEMEPCTKKWFKKYAPRPSETDLTFRLPRLDDLRYVPPPVDPAVQVAVNSYMTALIRGVRRS